MFGTHLLPNIGPSHLFHLPLPSHYPAIVAVPAVPLANAQMGQARAFSSTPTATSPLPPMPHHCCCQLHAMSPLLPTAVANHVCNVTTVDKPHHTPPLMIPACHVTLLNAPKRPYHAMSPPPTTTGCHVTT